MLVEWSYARRLTWLCINPFYFKRGFSYQMFLKHLMMSLSCVRILWWDLDSMAWAIAPLRRSILLTTLWFGFNHWFLKEPLLFKTRFEAVSKTIYQHIFRLYTLYKLCSNLETIVVQYLQYIYMISTSSIMKFHLLKWINFHFGS